MELRVNVPYSLKFITVPLKNGQCSITAQIILDRKKSQFATGIKCPMEAWDMEKGIFHDDLYLSNRLAEVERNIHKAYIGLKNSGVRPTSALLNRVVTGKQEAGSPALIDYIGSYIQNLKDKGTHRPKTIGMYGVMHRYVERFLRSKHLSDLRLNELRRKHIVEFEDFLLTTYNPQCNGPISRTSCNKNMKWLKAVVKDAYSRELIDRDPFVGFKMEHDRMSMEHLSEAEIRSIAQLELGEHPQLLNAQRMFIFACYSGLRFQDAVSLRRDQIFETGGRVWIKMIQIKTDAPLSRPLFRPAVEIVELYQRELPDMTTVLPPISNQYINRRLKQLAKLAGLGDRKVTFHTARHSHACLLISKGVDLLTTSYFMGHASVRTTEHYAKVSKERAMDVALNLDKNL